MTCLLAGGRRKGGGQRKEGACTLLIRIGEGLPRTEVTWAKGQGRETASARMEPSCKAQGEDRQGLEPAGTSGSHTKLKRQTLFSRGRSWVNERF